MNLIQSIKCLIGLHDVVINKTSSVGPSELFIKVNCSKCKKSLDIRDFDHWFYMRPIHLTRKMYKKYRKPK